MQEQRAVPPQALFTHLKGINLNHFNPNKEGIHNPFVWDKLELLQSALIRKPGQDQDIWSRTPYFSTLFFSCRITPIPLKNFWDSHNTTKTQWHILSSTYKMSSSDFNAWKIILLTEFLLKARLARSWRASFCGVLLSINPNHGGKKVCQLLICFLFY